MEPTEAQEFQSRITALAEMFSSKPPSKEVLKLYWVALSVLTFEEFERAVAILIRSHKYNTLPKPADFIEAVKPKIDRDAQAIIIWKDFEGMVGSYGCFNSIELANPALAATIEQLGGWMVLSDQVAHLQDFEYGQLKRDFQKTYARNVEVGTVPASMIFVGQLEAENIAKGYEVDHNEYTVKQLPDGSVHPLLDLPAPPEKKQIEGPE